ncbi:MAG: RlmE family RNA methyltransferase [Methylophilaceae bacterium]
MNRASKSWMMEHISDPYVKKAQMEGYRSRAAYKLIEIDRKYHFLKKGMSVVDFGSSPGGWSQVVSNKIGETGKVFAIDLLEMNPIKNVEFIRGDFTEQAVLDKLENKISNSGVDLVISDMSPNISGIKAVDQAGVIYLNELVLDFSSHWLKPKGHMVIKCFIGADFDSFVGSLRLIFKKVIKIKPRASRDRSSEIFIVGYEKK